MTVKEKLEAYRRQKRNDEIRKSIKNIVIDAWNWMRLKKIEEPTMDDKLCEEPQKNIKNAATDDISMEDCLLEEISSEENSDSDTTVSGHMVFARFIYILCLLLWMTLYLIALHYEFGAVYFVVSVLLFICVNTRSRPKLRGEPSAYSVFNANCEAIDGTLDASQFESELRYGIGGMR